MKNKILLFIFSLMIFFTGLGYGTAKTLEEVKEHNIKALENYSYDFKYTNQDDNIKRNLEYLKEHDNFVSQDYDSYKRRIKSQFYSYLVFKDLNNVLNYEGIKGIDMECYYKGDTIEKYISPGEWSTKVADKEQCDIDIYYQDDTVYTTTFYGKMTEVNGDKTISKEASNVASDLYGLFHVADIDMINHLVNYKTDTTTFFSSKNAPFEFSKIKNIIELNPKFDIFVGFEETRRGIAMTGVANGISYISYDGIIYDFAYETFYQSQFFFVPLNTKEEDYGKVLLEKIKNYVKDDSVEISITEGSNNEWSKSKYMDIAEVLEKINIITASDYYKMIDSDFNTEYTKYKNTCYMEENTSYCNDDEYYNKTKSVILAKLYTLKIDGKSYEIGILPMDDEHTKNYGVISSTDSTSGIIIKTKSGNVPFDASLTTSKYNLTDDEIKLLNSKGYTTINAYSFKLYSSILDKIISNFNGVTEILIPYNGNYLDKNLKMIYISDNDKLEVYDVNKVTYEGREYLSFNTSHFSNYILAYGEDISNPNTRDNIVVYIIVLLVALIGAFIVGITLKKKKKF